MVNASKYTQLTLIRIFDPKISKEVDHLSQFHFIYESVMTSII